jgi:outer membrane protein assembly factor BamD
MNRFANSVVAVALGLGLLSSCSFHRKKYENPITKDTQQPDKVLFDKAVNDIERGRFEIARLTLQTLINTYDTSEFLAKAKLAIADSWFREGGAHGMAQAEAEYKDFILFYPNMEEAAESQSRICKIHYKSMEKADRDNNHALRAEDECRQVLVQFPNSKFVPETQQILRNIQEVIAEGEYRVGTFYHAKGNWAASSNRLQMITDHFPLYSNSGDALFQLADDYTKMGPKFRQRAGDAYAKIVRDYPLSDRADDAKRRLEELEMPIPEADPVAIARMKYDEANYQKPGMMNPVTSVLKKGPDVRKASKSGTPVMTAMRPGIPVSVPVPAAPAAAGFNGDVTVSTVGDSSVLDSKPDARANPGAAAGPAGTAPAGAAPVAAEGAKPAEPAKPAEAKPEEQPTYRAIPKFKVKKPKKAKTPPPVAAPATTPAATTTSPAPAPPAEK